MEPNSKDTSQLKKQSIIAAYWLFGSMFLSQLISWSITILLARILSPGDYGILGMAFVMTNFLVLFNDVGLGPAIIQRKNITSQELSSCFWIIICIGIFLYILAFLFAPLAALFFHEEKLTSIIRILSIAFILGGCYQVPYNLLAKRLLFKKRGLIDFASKILNGLFALLFALSGYGVWSLVYGFIIGEVIKTILIFMVTRWFPRRACSYRSVRGLMNYGYKISGSRILWYFYSNSDYLIAGRMLGKILLGYYFMAFNLASIPLEKIVSLMKQISLPLFSELQDNDIILRNAYLKIVRTVAFITFPLFAGMALVANEGILALLSEKWLPMATAFKVLSIVSIFRSIGTFSDALVNAKGKPGISLSNSLMSAVIMPIAFIVGSRYGLNGLALAWLLVYPLLFMVIVQRAIKVVGLSLATFFKNLFYPFIGILLMFITISLAKIFLMNYQNIILKLIVVCSVGIITYIAFFMVFARNFLTEMKAIIKP